MGCDGDILTKATNQRTNYITLLTFLPWILKICKDMQRKRDDKANKETTRKQRMTYLYTYSDQKVTNNERLFRFENVRTFKQLIKSEHKY